MLKQPIPFFQPPRSPRTLATRVRKPFKRHLKPILQPQHREHRLLALAGTLDQSTRPIPTRTPTPPPYPLHRRTRTSTPFPVNSGGLHHLRTPAYDPSQHPRTDNDSPFSPPLLPSPEDGSDDDESLFSAVVPPPPPFSAREAAGSDGEEAGVAVIMPPLSGGGSSRGLAGTGVMEAMIREGGLLRLGAGGCRGRREGGAVLVDTRVVAHTRVETPWAVPMWSFDGQDEEARGDSARRRDA